MTLTDSLVIALAMAIVYKIILEYEMQNRQHPN